MAAPAALLHMALKFLLVPWVIQGILKIIKSGVQGLLRLRLRTSPLSLLLHHIPPKLTYVNPKSKGGKMHSTPSVGRIARTHGQRYADAGRGVDWARKNNATHTPFVLSIVCLLFYLFIWV